MKKIVLMVLLLSASAVAVMNFSFDETYPGLTSNSVVEIVYDSVGIWLGSVGGASYSTDEGQNWQTFRKGSGLYSNLVSAVAASKYNGTTYICVGTLHSEQMAGQSNEFGDGFSLTTDYGASWDTLMPHQANWVGMLSYDLDIYQDDIYSACWYGGLIRLMDAGQNREDSLWDNLYLNASDSIDLWVDSTFYNYTNYYFSVKVDTSLAPDTISVFAGSAEGINRFIFTRYGDGSKQNTAWNIAHSADDDGESLPGNFVVGLAINGRPGRVYDVFIEGDYAYVAHDFEGLWILDISNPDSLTAVGSCDTPGRAYGVTVQGDYAYVADYDQGLQIIDISDKTNPELTGSLFLDGQAVNVCIDSVYAYVSNEIYGFEIVDVSDPSNPFEPYTNSYYTQGWGVYDIFVSDNYAYVAASGAGFLIFDLTISPDSSLADSALVGSYDSLTSVRAVVVDSNMAYVADLDSGLYAIDITDPANPTREAFVRPAGKAVSVFFDGDYIYVADKISLNMYRLVEDTTVALLLAGEFETPGTPLSVMVSGSNAYVADNYFGLQAIDVADTADISITGNFAPVCSTYIWAACRIGGGESSGQKYGVAYSPNYGKTWTTVIEEPAWDFAFIGDTVIVATDDGLYISDNYQDWTVIREVNDSDPSSQRKFYESGFYAVETVGSVIWAGGADGTVRFENGDSSVFRSQIRAEEHFAYPSPFSPIASTRKGTTIHYKPREDAEVTIKIYDFNLDLVRVVIENETRLAEVDADNDVWDGRNDNGDLVANGIYFYNIKFDYGEDLWGKVAVVK